MGRREELEFIQDSGVFTLPCVHSIFNGRARSQREEAGAWPTPGIKTLCSDPALCDSASLGCSCEEDRRQQDSEEIILLGLEGTATSKSFLVALRKFFKDTWMWREAVVHHRCLLQ